MKRIDKPEAIEALYNQKLKEGKTKNEARKQLQMDQEFVNEVSKRNRIKKAKLKKDPKEINRLFKEASGNLR